MRVDSMNLFTQSEFGQGFRETLLQGQHDNTLRFNATLRQCSVFFCWVSFVFEVVCVNRLTREGT